MLIPPVGSSATVIATALAPLLRDAAAKLLVGCLRAHESIIVRRIQLDPNAGEMLTALVPISDAPPGEFETSRAAEITRWHTTLGSPVLSQLRTESCVIGAFQARAALSRTEIPSSVASDMIETLCRTAFPGLALSSGQIARYSELEVATTAAENVARVLRHPNPSQLRIALTSLLDAVQIDMDTISRLAKAALGLGS